MCKVQKRGKGGKRVKGKHVKGEPCKGGKRVKGEMGMGDTLKCPHAKHARVALVGRASEVLECARAFKRPRIQFKRPRMRARLNDDVFMRARLNDDVFRISIDYILELLARFARSPTITNTGQVLLHTCQVITPDNNIATVFNYGIKQLCHGNIGVMEYHRPALPSYIP